MLTPAIRAKVLLPLPLLVSWVLADHEDPPVTADDLALLAHRLDRGSYRHDPFRSCSRRGGSGDRAATATIPRSANCCAPRPRGPERDQAEYQTSKTRHTTIQRRPRDLGIGALRRGSDGLRGPPILVHEPPRPLSRPRPTAAQPQSTGAARMLGPVLAALPSRPARQA